MYRFGKKIAVVWMLVVLLSVTVQAQINTDRVMNIGRNALYFEDYILSIQYFNQVINVKPYLAEPYFYRAAAKLSLEDYKGAEEDAGKCLERNPFITGAYQVRGIARQNLGDYEGAIEDYSGGLKYAPEDRTFLGNKAIAEVQLKKYDEAEATFAELIKKHPSYCNAYLSRSQFWLEKKDTVKALSDIDKAITLDKHLSFAYAQRAIIKFQFGKDYADALEDMNQALKLDPNMTAYYLNRGIIRYYMDDLRGSMADYDRVIELDADNVMARYNRGLLRMQVGERNKAVEDFTFVLKYEPDNFFALYNRALLYDWLGNYRAAVADYDKVLEQYPDFPDGYYARSEAKRKQGNLSGGEKDYKKALALYQKQRRELETDPDGDPEEEPAADSDKTRRESDKNINKFDRLLVADNNDIKSKYENEIRGRVQDKNIKIEIEPPFLFTYYEKEDKVRSNVRYSKELDELNRLGLLPMKLLITNSEASLSTPQIERHFRSLDDYSRLIGINPDNPAPYFCRSLDYMLVQDFASAVEDLNRVIQLSDNFMFAYFNRAAVRFKQIEYTLSGESAAAAPDYPAAALASRMPAAKPLSGRDPAAGASDKKLSMEYEMVLRDYDKVIEMAPGFVYAYYNRANVRCAQKDFRAALADYNEAIRLKPDFADAYFNRGLVYVFLGENQKGIDDLSKAGELGIVSSYNIIKRLSD
ncbi:MAG: tetratricopeptide repeat protein [Coprobacter sp.]|nr:tetratricopeptide repeat protein [Coprobacter sp.]